MLGGRVGREGERVRREGWEGRRGLGGRVVREGERVRREGWEGREEGGRREG